MILKKNFERWILVNSEKFVGAALTVYVGSPAATGSSSGYPGRFSDTPAAKNREGPMAWDTSGLASAQLQPSPQPPNNEGLTVVMGALQSTPAKRDPTWSWEL